MSFANGGFYFQDGASVYRVPYANGDQTPQATPTQLMDVTYYADTLHWEKPLDLAADGTLYVGNGGSQGDECGGSVHGAILAADGAVGDGDMVATGLRWPTALRCTAAGSCLAVEDAEDYTEAEGGRSKLFAIHQGDDWGFPCCAAPNTPYSDAPPTTDCSGVAVEPVSFVVSDDPMGLDVEPGAWPAAWKGQAFVALAGAAGTYVGARIVAVGLDAAGRPVVGSDLGGADTGSMTDFATGWDDGTSGSHDYPFDVAFSADGRLYVANAGNGEIFWIAPIAP
jgi:glucose/arabinose dehydrogenase